MPFTTNINSATTLSIRPQPGLEKRLLASKSEAIFSFGDFTIEKNFAPLTITGDVKNVSFSTFDNLETLNAINISSNISSAFVQQNELNLPRRIPTSHSYFSSFYTNVASSINKIIDEYPYAILSYNNGGINIYDYEEFSDSILKERTSSFKIPTSGLINQDNIFLSSGNTQENYSLAYEYDQFCIQLSGQTSVFKIKNYAFSGTYLYFVVYEHLMSGSSSTTFSDALYIRPTIERMYNYNNKISTLESQLLGEGIFYIPQTETIENDFVSQKFVWPRTIDGWAPDSYGSNFEVYKEDILAAAERVDEEKTDIFIKTVIPENYLELDSSGQIYRTIIQSYAAEFDKLKNYIDAIAYAHNIEYSGEESVPKKFMIKLGNLLGWKLSDGFSNLDLFEYLTSDLDQNQNSYSYFNVEIWRRVLINIVWLYKRKGTRDAINFIFRLFGAPDCLINFNEFVYDITSTNYSSLKVDENDGYVNYSTSNYVFQEGGYGRGNGDAYINQWRPEFDPIIRADNRKIEIGDSTGGTRSIMNTKEIELGYSPSMAIENDVWQYYQQPCSYWSWGSLCPPFSCMTIPFEFLTFTEEDVHPVNITAMTLNQYINWVYTNSIDPTTRKTNAQCHTTWSYPELKNIYLSYYYATCIEGNNHLTVCRLEKYLNLLEVQLGNYILQLMPSTTIFEDGVGTKYKNPIFHRQRFVYREGIDKGSMFQRPLEDHPSANVIQCFPNTAKICIFTKQSYLPNGKLDITGNSWRVANNIPTQNICPSAKNIKAQYIHGSKIETLKTQIKQANISGVYIETKSTSLGVVRLRCSINSKSISTVIGAVTIASTSVSETSQLLISEEILTY